MNYYEFQYWPFDKKGNAKAHWALIEEPKEWAEHELDQVNMLPYYDSPHLTWYLIELEANTSLEAFIKAYNLLVKESKNLTFSDNNYYKVTYSSAEDEDGKEFDWFVTAILEDELKSQVNPVVVVGQTYEVIVKEPDVIKAFRLGNSLIQEFIIESEFEKVG
jgi:hypothetical protein